MVHPHDTVRYAGSAPASGARAPSDLLRGEAKDPVALAALELLEDSAGGAGALDGTPWLEVALGPDGLNLGGQRRRRRESADAG